MPATESTTEPNAEAPAAEKANTALPATENKAVECNAVELKKEIGKPSGTLGVQAEGMDAKGDASASGGEQKTDGTRTTKKTAQMEIWQEVRPWPGLPYGSDVAAEKN